MLRRPKATWRLVPYAVMMHLGLVQGRTGQGRRRRQNKRTNKEKEKKEPSLNQLCASGCNAVEIADLIPVAVLSFGGRVIFPRFTFCFGVVCVRSAPRKESASQHGLNRFPNKTKRNHPSNTLVTWPGLHGKAPCLSVETIADSPRAKRASSVRPNGGTRRMAVGTATGAMR